MSNKKNLRINDRIKVPRVRLIDQRGAQLGVLSTSEALRMGQEAGLDLVEVSPLADPPVCRLLNYGKYRFEQEKKIARAAEAPEGYQAKRGSDAT